MPENVAEYAGVFFEKDTRDTSPPFRDGEGAIEGVGPLENGPFQRFVSPARQEVAQSGVVVFRQQVSERCTILVERKRFEVGVVMGKEKGAERIGRESGEQQGLQRFSPLCHRLSKEGILIAGQIRFQVCMVLAE